MWYRVFGSLDAAPDFGADAPLVLERFHADDEGIRAELNSWAAFLETCGGPHHVRLMERTIQARQLFTLTDPTTDVVDPGCVALCRRLAAETAGFYQIDDIGFFDADGTLLVEERN
jgi:hypothetical protein